MHVLDFSDALNYLERALAILRAHAPSQHIVVTVSPVPMTATHRSADVIVANTYSKAVLRVVAETLTVKHEHVTYYPSFESVTLSDRKIAVMDDLVHVTPEIVALNVARMVEAMTDTAEIADPIADELVAVERAKAARARGQEYAQAFFGRHGEWSAKNCAFALEHARHLLAAKMPQEAADVLATHDAGAPNVALLLGEVLIALDRPREAYDLLQPACEKWSQSWPLWNTALTAALAMGDPEAINLVLMKFRKYLLPLSAPATIKVGQWFLARGDRERATALGCAALISPLLNGDAIALAEFFVALGKLDEAREALGSVAFPNGWEKMQADQLEAFLGEGKRA